MVRQEVFLAYQRELLDWQPEQMIDLMALMLGNLRCADIPYLVVAGEEQPDGYKDWLHEALPRSTLEVWTGSGHLPHLAHPERFASLLESLQI